MSTQGQEQKGGQQAYGPGNLSGGVYTADPYNRNGPSGFNSSYFSMGGSNRPAVDSFAPYGSFGQLGGGAPGQLPSVGSPMPFGSPMTGINMGSPVTANSNSPLNPWANSLYGNQQTNPFQGAPGQSGFNMPGQVNPFQQAGTADFGPIPPQNNFSQTPTALQGNVDPNSPQYAAYYNSLPASTRAYMTAPNSAQGNFRYQDQLLHPGSFF